jgi:hypothetical protein
MMARQRAQLDADRAATAERQARLARAREALNAAVAWLRAGG